MSVALDSLSLLLRSQRETEQMRLNNALRELEYADRQREREYQMAGTQLNLASAVNTQLMQSTASDFMSSTGLLNWYNPTTDADERSSSIEEFKEMKNTKCSSEMLKELFLHSFEDKLRGQITDKETKEKRNKKFSDIENEFLKIKEFYNIESGSNEPNLYNAFNAITQYETHEESSRIDKTESARIRFESLIRGRNGERILKARQKALSLTR